MFNVVWLPIRNFMVGPKAGRPAAGSCLTLVCCLLFLLFFVAPASAVLMRVEPLDGSFPHVLSGGAASNSIPKVSRAGRMGAESFDNLRSQMRLGNYAGIAEHARAVIETLPKSGLAYEVLGVAEFKLGRTGAAIRAFQQATSIEPNQSGSWAKLGILQMATDDLVDAETSLRKAISIDDDNRFAHQYLGLLLAYQGKTEAAIRHLQRGLEGTDPNYLGVAINLGRLLNEVGRYRQTVKVLAPRLPVTSDAALAHMILATAYFSTGRPKLAEQRFGRAWALDDGLKEAALGLAMAQREAGDGTASLELMNRLADMYPNWVAVYAERGETLLSLQRPSEAAAAFEHYVALGGDAANAKKRMARYYVEHAALDEAKAIYVELVDAGHADPEVYALLSELYLSAGRADAGEQVLRTGMKGFPDSAYLHFRLGSYLATLGRYAEAVTVLKQAAALAPEDPATLRALSLAQMRLGESDAAAASAGQLYDLVPRSDVAIFYASLLQASDRPQTAERIYQHVLTADPDNALALNNLANLLAQRNQLAKAERMARRAIAVAPDNGHVLDTLGWILYRRDKQDEAAELLRRAADLEPKNATIHYHHGMALAASGHQSAADAALTSALHLDENADWASDARARLKAGGN